MLKDISIYRPVWMGFDDNNKIRHMIRIEDCRVPKQAMIFLFDIPY